MSESRAHKDATSKAAGAEAAALGLLTDLGLQARKLPKHNDERMPDFFGQDARGIRYLIEVKEKFANPTKEKIRKDALSTEGVYSQTDPIGHVNRLSGIVGDAVDQLKSPAAPPADLRLMCFVASGRDPSIQVEQLFHTVYGAWTLVDLDTGESRFCLYYTFSDFFRYSKTLDGVLALEPRAATLWINSLSPRANLLAGCALATAMAGGVYDPTVQAERDLVYVADTNLSRRKRGPVLLYVQRKYDRWHRLTELAPVAYSAEVVDQVSVTDSARAEISR